MAKQQQKINLGPNLKTPMKETTTKNKLRP
jgi:hypothetical protein